VLENLHPTIKWSVQDPSYPCKPQVQVIPWQIVNWKENLNPVLNTSITKSSDSFVTAKGSMPLPDNITIPTGTKYKSNNHDEPNAIKKLKTSHNSNKDIIK
jgi:hypothetical protein